MKKLKVAIIGCGGVANWKHMPALSKVEECEIVAFCDLVESKAEQAAKKFGGPDAKVTTDYMEIVNDPDIDVVHVCTQNREHARLTVDCLRGGKHVMCEKPMAKTVAEAQTMIDAAKESGKKLTIGYQNRQKLSHQYIKARSQAGDFGEIYYAKGFATRQRCLPTWGYFINGYEQGGGPLIDIGTHALDLILWMMDNYEPEMVVGSVYRKLVDRLLEGEFKGECKPEDYTVEDSAFGYIRMKNGAVIELESAWMLNSPDTAEACMSISGTKAGATTNNNFRMVEENTWEFGREVFEQRRVENEEALEYMQSIGEYDAENYKNDGYMEAKQWIMSIINDTEPCVKPEQAFVVSQILEAIYESSKTGKPVYFD